MPPDDMHTVKLWMRKMQQELAEIALRVDQSRGTSTDQMRRVRELQDEADAAYKDFARQGGNASEADQNQALDIFRRLDQRLDTLRRQWLP